MRDYYWGVTRTLGPLKGDLSIRLVIFFGGNINLGPAIIVTKLTLSSSK